MSEKITLLPNSSWRSVVLRYTALPTVLTYYLAVRSAKATCGFGSYTDGGRGIDWGLGYILLLIKLELLFSHRCLGSYHLDYHQFYPYYQPDSLSFALLLFLSVSSASTTPFSEIVNLTEPYS